MVRVPLGMQWGLIVSHTHGTFAQWCAVGGNCASAPCRLAAASRVLVARHEAELQAAGRRFLEPIASPTRGGGGAGESIANNACVGSHASVVAHALRAMRQPAFICCFRWRRRRSPTPKHVKKVTFLVLFAEGAVALRDATEYVARRVRPLALARCVVLRCPFGRAAGP